MVAEDRYLAEDALELIDVDYEPLPAAVTAWLPERTSWWSASSSPTGTPATRVIAPDVGGGFGTKAVL